MVAARLLIQGTAAPLVEGLGLVSVSLGGLLAAYHFADRSLESAAAGTSRSIMVGALVVGATAWAAHFPRVRMMGAVAASMVVALAGVSGVYALAAAEEPFALGLVWALVPVAALVAVGLKLPKTGMIAAVLVGSAVAAAGAARYTDAFAAWVAFGAAVAAVAAWVALRGNTRVRDAVIVGASTPLAIGAIVAVGGVAVGVSELADHGTASAAGALNPWISLAALASAVGFIGVARVIAHPTNSVLPAVIAAVLTPVAALLGSYAIAGLVGDHANSVVALAAGVLAGGVAALGRLLADGPARRANAIGASVVVGIAGVHAAIALADASEPLVLGIAAVAVPVLGCAALARWWPAHTLPLASFIATAAGAAAAMRGDVPVAGVVAVSVGLAAVIAWLAPPKPPRLVTPLLFGLAPAALAGLGFLAVAVTAAVIRVFAFGRPLADPGNTGWVLAALLALAALAAAGRRHRATSRIFAPADYFGAIAVVAAMLTATDLLAEQWGRDALPLSLPATVAAAGAVAAAFVWWHKRARFMVGIGATAWVTVTQLAAFVPLYRGEHSVLLGAGVAAGVVAILAVAALRFTRTTLGPAVLLVTWGTFAAAGDGLEAVQGVAVMSVAVAILAWVLPRIAPGSALIGLFGLVPGAIAVGAAALTQLVPSLGEALGLYVEPYEPSQLWRVLLAAAGLAAALAWAPARRHAGWWMLPFIAIAAANVPREFAWVALVVLSLALTIAGRRINVLPEQALVVLLGSIVWTTAVLDLAVAASAATALALWVGSHEPEGVRKHGAFGVAPGFAAAAAAGVAAHFDATQAGVAAATLVTGMVAAFAIAASPLKPHPRATRYAVAAIGFVVPLLAGTLLAAGVLLLIAGVALFATAVQGWTIGRFLSSIALSVGTALVFADSGTSVVEAYTAVPALCALALGLWWLSENDKVGSFVATAPGLALGTIPSIIALAVNPDHLARTLALLRIALAIALWGVLARWFAPLLATAVVRAWALCYPGADGLRPGAPMGVRSSSWARCCIAIGATYREAQATAVTARLGAPPRISRVDFYSRARAGKVAGRRKKCMRPGASSSIGQSI